MAEFPAMPLWTDAYLADTTHLTTIEHGTFLLLLITMWRSKGYALPDDDRLLAKYSRLTVSQWRRIRPIIEPFFMVQNQVWSNSRLSDEVEAVRRQRMQRSDAGRASALKRKHRDATVVQRGANENATPIPIPIKNPPYPQKDAKQTPPPDLDFGEVDSGEKDPPKPNGHDPGFDQFWEVYPRRDKKIGARAKFDIIIKKKTATAAEIISGAKRYADHVQSNGTPPDKIPMPTTWLNNGQWADETPGGCGTGRKLTAEERARMAELETELGIKREGDG